MHKVTKAFHTWLVEHKLKGWDVDETMERQLEVCWDAAIMLIRNEVDGMCNTLDDIVYEEWFEDEN